MCIAHCHDIPVEIHPFLRELPVAMVRVLEGLVLDDLYPFSSVTLFVAVLADHVQLSDFVLQSTQTQRQRGQPPSLFLTNPPPTVAPEQLMTSAPSAEKRKQALVPNVTFLWELGRELVVTRMQKRHVPANVPHHLGKCSLG